MPATHTVTHSEDASGEQPAAGGDRTHLDLSLGARIKDERVTRGWSLADLSERSGVSKAQVNKVERGISSPTASLLGRLSAAFGLTVSALLARAEVATAPGHVVRHDEHPQWQDPDTGYIRRQITSSSQSQLPVELVHVELPPGAAVTYPASAFVFIRQVVLTLTGQLTFIDGPATHTMRSGDSIALGPPAERTFRNDGRKTCTYLVAVSQH